MLYVQLKECDLEWKLKNGCLEAVRQCLPRDDLPLPKRQGLVPITTFAKAAKEPFRNQLACHILSSGGCSRTYGSAAWKGNLLSKYYMHQLRKDFAHDPRQSSILAFEGLRHPVNNHTDQRRSQIPQSPFGALLGVTIPEHVPQQKEVSLNH